MKCFSNKALHLYPLFIRYCKFSDFLPGYELFRGAIILAGKIEHSERKDDEYMGCVTEPARDIPVDASADIVVCGGGPSGIMAAISAARNGASTILIERYGFLGGTATQSMVSPISKFNYNGKRIIGGIPLEFIKAMEELGGAVTDYPSGNIPFDPEIYKLVSQEMLCKEGVKLYLHSQICGCMTDKEDCGKITHAILEGKSGRFAVEGKYFIDCTGDGDLIHYAGMPFLFENATDKELQPMTLWFRLGGVDTEQLENMIPSQDNTRYYNKRISDLFKDLSEKNIDIPKFGGPWFFTNLREKEATVNVTRFAGDGTDVRSLTTAECTLRRDMFRIIWLLREYVPELKNSFLMDSGVQVGVRETRRIEGIYIMSAEDILEPKDFADTVAKGAHPIDIHRTRSSEQNVTFISKDYNIPYRTMVPKGSTNVLAAGRIISTTREANASIRVQATCMALGQAAGASAALAMRGGASVKEIDIKALREKLMKEGCVLS